MPFEYTEDDFLNNLKLTPQEYYTLQSETWGQGFEEGVREAISVFEVSLKHNGKTHYTGIECWFCDAVNKLEDRLADPDEEEDLND